MSSRILVVDDEPNIRNAVEEFLKTEGWLVKTAADGLAAQSLLGTEAFDLVVSDIRMPGLTGYQLLEWILDQGPQIPVIFMTAHGDVQDAVEALKLGAADYLLKPFDFSELIQRVRRALGIQDLQRAAAPNRLTVGRGWFFPTQGPMAPILRLAEQAAPTDATVLITGESGTGKEVLARYLHEKSSRSSGPFVPIVGAAIPETLLESELFGHEKGAFSGATNRKIGFFEAAQGGTVFLDEIGELPLHLQVKLLRVIQERSLVRVGSTTPIPLDVRIISATNRDLGAMVAEGSFRQDLYYRLQVITLVMPPLRDRLTDLEDLVDFLLPKLGIKLGLPVPTELPSGLLTALQAYKFPGNIRELENILERFLIVGDPNLLSLPTASTIAPTAPTDAPTGYNLNEWEHYLIHRALEKCGGNRTQAALELGIGRRTLQEKIARYAIGTTKGTLEDV